MGEPQICSGYGIEEQILAFSRDQTLLVDASTSHFFATAISAHKEQQFEYFALKLYCICIELPVCLKLQN
jgi:hypothetical protein